MDKKYYKYGVIGHPIGHTLSPFIHARLMKLAGIVGEYGVYDVAPEELAEKFHGELAELDGFNATIPHKQAVMRLCSELDETAELYGSVNTVLYSESGTKGFTTDGIGFTMALESAGIPMGDTVTIVGCGGVGRVFANTCTKAGCKLNILECSAALDGARAFAESINARFGEGTARVFLTENYSEPCDLLVNATPIGMFPNTDKCAVSDDVISKAGAVFDAVYNPAQTLLVKKARDMGIPAITGMTMLVYQAAAAQTIWNGSTFEKSDIEQLARDCFKEIE